MIINWLGIVPVLLLAAFDWLAVWRNWGRMHYLTKPVVLLALIAWFWLSGGWQGHLSWFGFGLVFSLLGDVLLMSSSYFMGGLISFLIAHVFFIIAYNPRPIPTQPAALIMTVLIWLGAVLFFRRLIAVIRARDENSLLPFPILLYILAVSIMLLSAAATLVRPEWPLNAALLAAGGGLLFFISDGLLAYNRFIHPIPRGQLLVRICYHLGQIAMTSGILLYAA